MAIPKGYARNFDTLLRAAHNGDLALMECTGKTTGKPVYTIAMANRMPDGSVEFAPVAKMFDGNPYEELNPPA